LGKNADFWKTKNDDDFWFLFNKPIFWTILQVCLMGSEVKPFGRSLICLQAGMPFPSLA